MGYRIISVPNAGDCFFHCVAFFLGAKPDDVEAAAAVRSTLARQGYALLFQAGAPDFAELADTIEYSTDGTELNALKFRNDRDAQELIIAYKHGPYTDDGNGGGCHPALWLVWLDKDVAAIEKLSKGSGSPWARAYHKAYSYTLWGDGSFVPRLVQAHFGLQVRIFNEDNIDTIDDADRVVNVLHRGGNHFDVVEWQPDDEEEEEEIGPRAAPDPNNLTVEIHHIDVGQGDATLIVVRHEKKPIQSVLIDAGDKGMAPRVHEHMVRLGLKTLDTLAITHYDKDHFRGAVTLLHGDATSDDSSWPGSILCQNTFVFDRGDPDEPEYSSPLARSLKKTELEDDRMDEDEDDYEMFALQRQEELEDDISGLTDQEILALDYLVNGPGRKLRVSAGKHPKDLVGTCVMDIGDGLLRLDCVAAAGHIIGGGYVRPLHSDRENARSLAFLLRFGKFAYLIAGDAPGESSCDVEGAIAKGIQTTFGIPHVCALKCSHHGSHHSTKPAFVSRLSPTTAFISAGIHGKFLHPRQEPITALMRTPSVKNIYTTRCAYDVEGVTPHGKIQDGPVRVAGDEKTLGTIVLRIDLTTAFDHIFYVGYWDQECRCWRLQRQCCVDAKLNEEVTRAESDYPELIVPCKAEPSSRTPTALETLDAIHQRWAAADEGYVRGIAANDPGSFTRDAARATRDGTEIAEERELKTVQTIEMVEDLDLRTEGEIAMLEARAEAADDDFDPCSEDFSEESYSDSYSD